MAERQVAPYGSWQSPITAAMVGESGIRVSDIRLDGEDRYWVEGRPREAGRHVIVRTGAGREPEEITPEGYDVRTRVYEMGGAPFAVDAGTVYFSNFEDSRVYCQPPGGTPEPVTTDGRYRYADFSVDAGRQRLIAVREDQTRPDGEVIHCLVALPWRRDREETILTAGNDFYSSPRLSADGTRLAWLTWNRPNMPWDGTELWVADLDDGSPKDARLVAGGRAESIFQPSWSPEGRLYFVSDRTGWWNLYRESAGRSEILLERPAELGQPQWLLGMSNYAFERNDVIIATCFEGHRWRLVRIRVDGQYPVIEELETPYTHIEEVHATAENVIFKGGSPTLPEAVVERRLTDGASRELRSSRTKTPEPGYLSIPEAIDFPTADGQIAHGYFYPPTNPEFEGPESERAPLMVRCHGGPTSSASTALDLRTLFWTSRGFGVFYLNYRGSTGYGRAYREQLKGNWGIADVEDSIYAGRFLAARGDADPDRMLIAGGSAGGYTTLAALTFHSFFKAGASYYGVSDLEGLARETHKFESRYLDQLIGPYPEEREKYRARSPVHHVEKLATPVIVFQGLEDAIVPPNQSERIVEAVRRKGIPVAYVAFEGEQHGFRKAETIRRCLEAELSFYARVLGLTPADVLEPIRFENEKAGESTS